MVKNENNLDEFLSGKTEKDENFPVSSFLISSENKTHIKNFYIFARTADDIADHKKLSSREKIKILKILDQNLKEQRKGSYVFIDDLIETLKNTKVSAQLPRNLLKAFIMDASKNRYENWSELINYCNFSASPVGRFVVDLHNEENKSDKKRLQKIYDGCDNLCNSLQILNHIQDCKDDFENMNRIYIPKEYFRNEKIKAEEIIEKDKRENVLKILRQCLENVDILLEKSKKTIVLIRTPSLKKETMVIFNIAKKLCWLLKRNDPIKKKVKLSRIELIFCFFRGIIGRL